MRILLVTGKLAAPLVKQIVSRIKTRHKVGIVVLPVNVIVLLSTDRIASELVKLGIGKGKYDLIIVPGGCRGSAEVITEKIGIEAVKGPLHAHDLELVLQLDDPAKILSPIKPADEVLKGLIVSRNIRLLESLEESLSEKGHIIIGNLAIPVNPPPIRVIGEITEAHRYELSELIDRVNRLVDNGAQIISLGFEAEEPHPDTVYRVIRFVRKEVDVPIAVDTLIPSEIFRAVEAGVDLVMSLELSNIDKIAPIVREIPVVLIPYDNSKKYLPSDPSERVYMLERILGRARSLGVKHLIADLILDPPVVGWTFRSLQAYARFKEEHPKIPLLMGMGNVVELMDVDTVGVNALLTLLAMEIGVSLLLVVEKSVKAQGSVRETAIATQMASIAYLRKTPPKDLGIDLLILKDKRRITMPMEIRGAEVIYVKDYRRQYKLDPLGIFKIRVNHREKYIEVLYIGRKGKILFKGKSAADLSRYIIDKGLVSLLDHAAYLGRELAKAEEALKIGKNYYQERPLFIIKKPLKVYQIKDVDRDIKGGV